MAILFPFYLIPSYFFLINIAFLIIGIMVFIDKLNNFSKLELACKTLSEEIKKLENGIEKNN
jgi:hypothetical protein